MSVDKVQSTLRLERVATVVVILMFGLALSFYVPDVRLPIVGVLLLVAVLGAESTVHSHPHTQLWPFPRFRVGGSKVEVAPRYWTLPVLLTLGASLFLGIFRDGFAIGVILVVTAVALSATFVSMYHSLDSRDRYYGLANSALNLISHLTAFALFSSIYQFKLRTIFSGSMVLLFGSLLMFELLTRAGGLGYGVLGTGTSRFSFDEAGRLNNRAFILAGIAGLLLGQVTWAINYWPVFPLVGGMFLLLSFYILGGLMSLYLTGQLTRNTVVEFSVVGVLGMVFVYVTSFLSRGLRHQKLNLWATSYAARRPVSQGQQGCHPHRSRGSRRACPRRSQQWLRR